VAGEDDHAVLAGELAEAPGVVRAADGAVAVQVETAGDPGVHGGGEGVRVEDRGAAVLGDLEVVPAEQVHAASLLVVVELVQQQHVGVVDLDDLRDRPDLRVRAGGEVLEQLPGPGPVQGGVEGGDPQVRPACAAPALGRGGGLGDGRQRGPDPGGGGHGECSAA